MFKKIIIDGDTPVLRAAIDVQETYVLVTNKQSGKTQKYKSRMEFYGHWKNKNGGALAAINEKYGKAYTSEDFDYEDVVKVRDGIDPIEEGVKHFDFFIGKIKRADLAVDYEIVLGGGECYRHEYAKILEYKGTRTDKPLMFAEVKEAIIKKYGKRVTIVSGMEADDYLGIKGYENFKEYKKSGSWDYLLAYIDNDIDMVISPSIDPYDLKGGIHYTTPSEGALCFASQLLSGDTVDNIQGLPKFTDDITTKYGLRKGRGIGKATALPFLEGQTTKEVFRRVCEAYHSYYGSEKLPMVSWTGETLKYNWLDYLKENAILLWMQREENERFDMEEFLTKIGIDLDEFK